MKEIYLAGGCFWGMEQYLNAMRGVILTQVGYANGKTEQPSYEEVCRGDTDHVETVKVSYDPSKMPLSRLLKLFYAAIDPLSVNRQGPDIGTQYRSGIYYTDPADQAIIEGSLQDLAASLGKKPAIEAGPLLRFDLAEEYHQKYLDKNPGGYCHINHDHVLRNLLTERQYAVTQMNATEPPFQNEFWNEKREGLYVDVITGVPLFSSKDKFESGCGWPSFTKPVVDSVIFEKTDRTHGMLRTEVRSKEADAHLGHVFDDGPKERGGLRYCINSAAMRFIPKEDLEKEGYGEWLK